jgi:hypothetical protein
MFKNVTGQKIRVFAFNRLTNEPETGDAANITGKVAKDHAAAAAITDTNPTEVEDGYYLFDLTQAETNADVLDFYPESSTGDVQVIAVPGTVYTVPANFTALGIESDGDLTKVNTLDGHTAQTGDSYARIGAPAGVSIAADLLTIANATDDLETRLTADRAGYLDKLNITGDVAGANELATVDGIVDEILLDTAEIGTAAGADIAADIAAVKTDTGNLVTRITSTLFTGITSMAEWLGLLAGKQTGDSTARTELRATGAGSGTFDETDDSLEAIRDRGDAEWTTGAGGSGAGAGADAVTLNFKDGDSNPIADAQVWVTSDSDGSTIVAGYLLTDSAGDVTFMLDDGVAYYAWLQKDGVNPVLGESFTASAD